MNLASSDFSSGVDPWVSVRLYSDFAYNQLKSKRTDASLLNTALLKQCVAETLL